MPTSLDRRAFMAAAASALPLAQSGAAQAQNPAKPAVAARARGFGWIPDLPDPTDRTFRAPFEVQKGPRPPSVDLSSKLPLPYDQGQLGSCTANAIAAAVQHARRLHQKPGDFVPSRLFIYYQERKLEGTIYTDSGASIRDGIRSIVDVGVPPETDWAYDGIAGDSVTHVFPPHAKAIQAPPPAVLAKASSYATISYARLEQDLAVLESCLASGYPFIFGFRVYDNLTGSTKVLKAPGPGDHKTNFGHAVLAVGYDQGKKTFRIRNSWGPDANDHGHFDMAYDYVLDAGLARDFWVVYQTLAIM